MTSLPRFQSFVMAGFECSYPLTEKGVRWDLLRDSRHEKYCREDYRRLKQLGITTVREGLAWHQIDRGRGRYDYSRFETMMRIGREEGMQQIWDFNHYDFPEDLDIFSPAFIKRFADYALNTINVIRTYQSSPIYVVLINEISYIAWISGDMGKWAPYTKGQANGIRLKKQLIRATIAAMKAISKRYRNVRFIQVDPYMYRQALAPALPAATKAARDFNRIARYQTWDILRGAGKFLDIIGVNYYIDNQQWLKSKPGGRIQFQRVPLQSPQRRTLYHMLSEVYARYRRPMVLMETGSYGPYRTAWWRRLVPEVQECLERGLPLYGVCVYPTLDNPDHGHFLAPHSGIFDFRPGDKTYQRVPHVRSIREIKKLIALTADR
jgi:beta-glucosidase/6-phospho-beta-glucosidase/beta-galactosidase